MASDVRRYARGELLPQQQREAVEQALIDDDRARRLVINTKPVENALREVPETTDLLLRKSQLACSKSIKAYESLLISRRHPETVVRFSAIRHNARRAMLQDIACHRRNMPQGVCEFGYLSMPCLGGDAPLAKAIDEAAKCDRKLLLSLSEAYSAPSSPPIKVKIASWILEIDEDTTRIAWLKSAIESAR